MVDPELLAASVMRLSIYAGQWKGHPSSEGRRAEDIVRVLAALAVGQALPICQRHATAGFECVRGQGHFGHCVAPGGAPIHSSAGPIPCPECGWRL